MGLTAFAQIGAAQEDIITINDEITAINERINPLLI
jgi:hypothetical protein